MRSVRKIPLTGSDQVIYARQCRLVGFFIRESGGSSSATALLYDNASAASGTVIPVALSAGESAREWWADASDGVEPGLLMEAGIYLDVGGSGTVQGCILVLDG